MLARARACLAQGRVEDAADTLQRAIDELDARNEGQSQAADSLTPSELRVARMAASGMKNREIAEQLTVTVKAVEYHLANTYRKLGIGGRAELTRMFNWATPVLASLVAG